MRKRVSVPRDARPPISEFTPVPRKYLHDGWPLWLRHSFASDRLRMSGLERQKAFVEALAGCESVTRRPMAQVNMARANCYTLRRAPGGGEEPMASANIGNIRRSRSRASRTSGWRLAAPCCATERAIDGQLHPVFRGGKRTAVVGGPK